MFNSNVVCHPVLLWDLSWWGSPHTLFITDVSLVCWFHLKVFTALFLISEGTADIEIRGLPAGGIVSAEGGVWEQKTKIKNWIADMNDLRKLVSAYGKIGSNLNQIAKHFNSGGSQSRAIENEIHQCITDLFLLRKEVLKLAGGMNGNRKTH